MKWKDYQAADVQEQLKFWINFPRGSFLSSDWPDANVWSTHIREVCEKALKEIQFLRKVAGAVSGGPSFTDLKAGISGSPGTNPKDA